MELHTRRAPKYPTSALSGSAAGLGCFTISVELRRPGVRETRVIVPLQNVELILAVVGDDEGLAIRAVLGQRMKTIPSTEDFCPTPVAVDNQIAIKAPISKTPHLHVPATLFRKFADDFNLPGAPAQSIRCVAGVRDAVIYQLALSIISAMTNEIAAERMSGETASATLAARLVQEHGDSGACRSLEPTTRRIDDARLRRVFDHISANLDEEITLTQLAQVAGISMFHFARMFTRAMGVSPSRYVSRMRLERAMTEIAAGKLCLAEIAFRAGFSSQASFTTAFRRVTGLAPGEFRSHLNDLPHSSFERGRAQDYSKQSQSPARSRGKLSSRRGDRG